VGKKNKKGPDAKEQGVAVESEPEKKGKRCWGAVIRTKRLDGAGASLRGDSREKEEKAVPGWNTTMSVGL